MTDFGNRGRLPQLTAAAEVALVAAARSTEPVTGLTHGFYKYPARFSPAFVRGAIETFTQPGDLVLDNHVGGGTTLVESLAMGRHAIGIDLNNQPARMEYFVVKQTNGGATIAARLQPNEAATLRPEIEALARSLTITTTAPIGVVPLPGK
jgi:hypothetical protein